MGTPVPVPPEILDTKWYCVTTDVWVPAGPGGGCTGFIDSTRNCCIIGSWLNTVIDMDFMCDHGAFLCNFDFFKAEIIRDIKGPYDNAGLCGGDCP